MKKKTKLLLTLGLGAVTCMCLGIGVGCSGTKDGPMGEAYDWSFDKPQAGTPDAYMKIDGKLDEDVWKTKNALSQTVKGVSWSAKTHFSEKGVYVGLSATDDTMYYRTRYTSRSAFDVYICKTGTQTYDLNNLDTHPARTFIFTLDPYYCRSKSRIPYNYKAHVEGELNSETECTMTAELFLTWQDLYYTQEELGADGYPEDIQMYVNYEGEKSEVLGSCLWREETYFAFDKDGYAGGIESETYGSIANGLAATDRWEINAEGKAQTTAGRTQILWLKNAYAKDFMFEAELRPLSKKADGSDITMRGSSVWGRFGLINETPNGDYTVFSANARQLSNNKRVELTSCRQIDSFHWQNKIGLSETVATDYAEDTLILRVIKQGDMFYYFYGDSYWGCERIAAMQEEAYCGFFTSQGMIVENSSFTDYTGKSDELKSALSDYVYFIDVAGEMTRGSVSASATAVGKGKEVTISFLPKSKSVLTGITRDGADAYDEIVAAMSDECEYTFTPTADVSFGAEFTAFNDDDLVRTIVVFQDKDKQHIKDANYEISGSNKLLFYKGTPNNAGYVVLQIPKAGTYTVGGKEFTVDGTYALRSTFADHHDVDTEFTLTDGVTSTDINGKEESVSGTKSCTLYVEAPENEWGAVTVNGMKITGSGKLSYNESTQNYFVEGTNGVRRYYKTMVGENFVLNAHISMTEVGGNGGHLAAVALTDGNDVLVLKYNIEQWGNLIIATGNSATETSAEFAITGFDWSGRKHTLASDTAKGETEMAFKLVKCGSVLYLFNHDGQPRAYFNKEGIHLIDSRILWGENNLSAVNDDIKGLFSTGDELAAGVFTYPDTGLRAEFDFEFTDDLEAVHTAAIDYGAMTLNLPEGCTLAKAYPVREGYGKGEIIQIGVNVKNARRAKLRLLVNDGNGQRIIDGKYDWSNGCIVFTFEYYGGETQADVTIVENGEMSWSNDWGEFIPDRDNTLLDQGGGA